MRCSCWRLLFLFDQINRSPWFDVDKVIISYWFLWRTDENFPSSEEKAWISEKWRLIKLLDCLIKKKIKQKYLLENNKWINANIIFWYEWMEENVRRNEEEMRKRMRMSETMKNEKTKWEGNERDNEEERLGI